MNIHPTWGISCYTVLNTTADRKKTKKKKHRCDEHSTKEVHAQASCFMYVDFVIVIKSMFPIKEPQCIADALCCQQTLWLVKWRWTIRVTWKGEKKLQWASQRERTQQSKQYVVMWHSNAT